eukprot:1842812-Alexandrium_andersonii.AAC.1
MPLARGPLGAEMVPPGVGLMGRGLSPLELRQSRRMKRAGTGRAMPMLLHLGYSTLGPASTW